MGPDHVRNGNNFRDDFSYERGSALDAGTDKTLGREKRQQCFYRVQRGNGLSPARSFLRRLCVNVNSSMALVNVHIDRRVQNPKQMPFRNFLTMDRCLNAK